MTLNLPDPSAPLRRIGALLALHTSPADIPADLWVAIAPLAVQHRLAPMLLWTLRQQGFSVGEQPALAAVVTAAHQTALSNLIYGRSQRAIDDALRAAGIPAVWIKGAALAHTVYPQASLRPMVDLDVLIPYEQREAALAAVKAVGYDFYAVEGILADTSGDALTQKFSYHYQLRGGIGGQVDVELHFRLLSNTDTLLSAADLRWFGSQTHTVTVDPLPGGLLTFTTLTPEAHLLYLCAHATLQHLADYTLLMRYFDLHLLIRAAPLDWTLIVDRAVALAWTRAVETALRRCVTYFETPVPPAVLDALVTRRPPHEDVARVDRGLEAGHRWQSIREHIGVLTVREQIRYVRRIAIPSQAYMRDRYAIPIGRPVWPYYLYRWGDQAGDVLAAMWKRIRGR